MAEVGADLLLPINRGELDLSPPELIRLGKKLKEDGAWRFLVLSNDEYILPKPKLAHKSRIVNHSSSIGSDASTPQVSISESHPLYELITNSYSALAKRPPWSKKIHKILLILCSNANCNGFLRKIPVDDPLFCEFSAKVIPLKYITLQDVLEKLINCSYESTVEALSDIYCVLICAFRLVDPGSDEWMKIHRVSTLLSNLVVSENLKDNYILQNDLQQNNRYKSTDSYIKRDRQINNIGKVSKNKGKYEDNFAKSQSELEFEQELLKIAANKKQSYEFAQENLHLPVHNVPPITYEERLEFQEVLSKLPEECHLELFTTFEKIAAWKNVEDEIELDDHATDPLVFRSLIQWAKDRIT